MSAPVPPITLTTDFGESDHYVAQMKGVILGLAPGAPMIDVTHRIPPQDVRRAAYLLGDLGDAFPPGTAHVAVVDPGVGSNRSILAVAAGGRFYIAPDNGLLTSVFARFPDAEVVEVTNPDIRRSEVSATFHGRDVIAPAAARLVCGASLRDLGPPPGHLPVRLGGMTPVVVGRITGEVAWVDGFGNLITNIPAGLLADIRPDRLRARVGSREFVGLRRFYAEVAGGEPLVIVGSSGRLEVAVNGGDASAVLGLKAGAEVVVDAEGC